MRTKEHGGEDDKRKGKTLYSTCVSFYKCRFSLTVIFIGLMSSALPVMNEPRVARLNKMTCSHEQNIASNSFSTGHSTPMHAALPGARSTIHLLRGKHPMETR